MDLKLGVGRSLAGTTRSPLRTYTDLTNMENESPLVDGMVETEELVGESMLLKQRLDHQCETNHRMMDKEWVLGCQRLAAISQY